uniref:Uncharacterized protein n=1 Tax=Neobodo designis TaxID=312471 RepID=A0A7S1LW77_NEODS
MASIEPHIQATLQQFDCQLVPCPLGKCRKSVIALAATLAVMRNRRDVLQTAAHTSISPAQLKCLSSQQLFVLCNDLLTLASVESINDMSTSAAVCLATAIEQWVDKLEAAVSVASKRTMSAPLARKLCAFEKEVTELLTPETGRRVVSLSIDRALESALERCLDDATLLGSLECVMEVLEPYWDETTPNVATLLRLARPRQQTPE